MMTFSGTIKFAKSYDVKGKDGSQKPMLVITAADEIGNTFGFQMWSDDAQQAQLLPIIDQLRHQKITLMIQSFSLRIRKDKEGKDIPQANFIMTDVQFPAVVAQTA